MDVYQIKQHQLIEDMEAGFRRGERPSEIVEPVADYINDNRVTLTTVAFLPKPIQDAVNKKVSSQLRYLDLNQYKYPTQSLHLTIQNIRTISEVPLFSSDDVNKVQEAFREVIPRHRVIDFKLKGLLETPTSLGIRGYSDQALQELILDLRTTLEHIGVPDNKKLSSFDIFFGNITIYRYTKDPNDKFLAKVKELKEVEVGEWTVRTLSLITTNAVCHPDKTTIIEEYNLKA
ncbi:MAG: hypothetical protein ABII24_00850 [bacterium]